MAVAPRSAELSLLRPPSILPIGVRAPATRTAVGVCVMVFPSGNYVACILVPTFVTVGKVM